MSDQTRRVAIVTGAAGGTGSAITRRLEKDGVDVVAVGLVAVGLDPAAPREASGGVRTAFVADLTTREVNEGTVTMDQGWTAR